MNDRSAFITWSPPRDVHRILTIDAHAAGEPLRVIVSGFPELSGGSIPAMRRDALFHCDRFRTALMWEPRGHADMYGCLLTPPVTPGADFGVLFLHNEGYSTMCGHGIIAVVTVVLETGLLPAGTERVVIDTPAGCVTATARTHGGRVRSVRFTNVPSYVVATGQSIAVPGVGVVRYDVAYGGAFYALVSAEELGLRLHPEDLRTLIHTGRGIKNEIARTLQLSHPGGEDLAFLYGTIFVGPPVDPGSHSRNVCIFADGEVDRSPTGTGVSARLALHYAAGEVRAGETIVIESILGTTFRGTVAGSTMVGDIPAVIPDVEGSAIITGRHEFFLYPDDPLLNGFLLR